jgi:hypothetical protein
MAVLSLWRKSCYGFLSLIKNPSLSVGLEPANLGSDGKHTNHYTTENDLRKAM